MRVLQIANGYLDKALYKNLFDQLADIGVDNQVFVPLQYGDKRKSQEHNVNVVTCFNKIDRLLFFPKQWKTDKAIGSLYDFQSIEITHAHTLFSTGYIANILKKKHGIPYIVAVRNTDVNLFFAKQPHLRGVGISILNDKNSIRIDPDSVDEIAEALQALVRDKELRDRMSLAAVQSACELSIEKRAEKIEQFMMN